jgi:hypothetical protein
MSTFIKSLLVSAGMAVLVAVTYAQTAPADPANPEAVSSPHEAESDGKALQVRGGEQMVQPNAPANDVRHTLLDAKKCQTDTSPFPLARI